jgi:4-carboxymuconolactone decarboxylase
VTEQFDRVTATRERPANDAGFRTATPDGRLIGPFNAFLLRPEVALTLLEFSSTTQSQTSLSARVREVLIFAVGALWDAQFELYAHSALAHRAGLSTESITALVSGRLPDDLSAHEKVAGRVAQQLSTRHRIDDELYREAQDASAQRDCLIRLRSDGIYRDDDGAQYELAILGFEFLHSAGRLVRSSSRRDHIPRTEVRKRRQPGDAVCAGLVTGRSAIFRI